ncbi:MAG: ABC transporter permease [Candidatus Eisenbacteria bacterium]
MKKHAPSGGGLPEARSVPELALREARILPSPGWEIPDFGELWRHRHLLFVLVWRNVTRRYRQTLLGPVWFVISPLVRIVLYSLVLGRLAGLPSEGVPYPIFSYAALLPWEMFASGILRSTGCFVTYEQIITKVYFPRLLVPAAEVMTAVVDFFLSFVILVAMAVFFGFYPNVKWLVLPFLLLMAAGLSLSVGFLFAALQVRYRDVANFMRYGVTFWFYATPVAYSSTVLEGKVPDGLRAIYVYNPMNGVVEAFRWAMIGAGRAPDLTLGATAVAIGALLFFSSMVFLKTEHSIVDLV